MSEEVAGWMASLCAWLPLAVLLPVAGAPGLPLAVRISVALGLSFAGPRLSLAPHEHVVLACVRSLATGVSAALGALVVLSAARMAGGIGDRLLRPGTTEAQHGPLEALFGLTSCLVFLASGGPALVGSALVQLNGGVSGGAELGHLLADAALAATTIAVVVAAPLLVTSVLVEIVFVLAARASWPLALEAVFPPLRALAFLVALALGFETMVEALAMALR